MLLNVLEAFEKTLNTTMALYLEQKKFYLFEKIKKKGEL